MLNLPLNRSITESELLAHLALNLTRIESDNMREDRKNRQLRAESVQAISQSTTKIEHSLTKDEEETHLAKERG